MATEYLRTRHMLHSQKAEQFTEQSGDLRLHGSI